jgi:hypothetical protein
MPSETSGKYLCECLLMSLDPILAAPTKSDLGSFLAAPVFLCTRLRHLQRSATSHASEGDGDGDSKSFAILCAILCKVSGTAESLWDFQKCQKCQKCPICWFQASNMSWSWSPKREAHWIKGFRSMPSLDAKTENSGWSFHGKNMSSWETQEIHGNACSSHTCIINRLRHSTHSYLVDLQRLIFTLSNILKTTLGLKHSYSRHVHLIGFDPSRDKLCPTRGIILMIWARLSSPRYPCEGTNPQIAGICGCLMMFVLPKSYRNIEKCLNLSPYSNPWTTDYAGMQMNYFVIPYPHILTAKKWHKRILSQYLHLKSIVEIPSRQHP